MTTDVVAKLWGFCHTLRHDGIGYSHYVEQLTYLLFLKMASEREIGLPKGTDWAHLRSLSGTDLLDAYIEALRLLGKQPGMLGDIFSGAQSRFSNPVNLKKLISLIDETEWTSLDVDVKAAAFEGLIEKAASEGKKGAGQYFTPRLLIKAIVRCMKPDPRLSRGFKIDDPACGTGGFLVASFEWLLAETKGALDRDVAKRIRTQTYFGQDIDPEPRRLAVMNLYLHQVEPHIERKDSISEMPSAERYDVVLTNPPFGTRGANEEPHRDDFTVSTSNKQLNFIQHVLTILKPGGRAAIVVPDNVLFADQAGEVFKVLMEDCDLHTVLRLPRGTFSPYSEGTKTNVIFLTKGRPTEKIWIYDARANVPKITKKDRPLVAAHFAEFETCYGDDPSGRSTRSEKHSVEGRWRSFGIDEVKAGQYKLDAFKWIRDNELDDPDVIVDPEEQIGAAIEDLQLALSELAAIRRLLESKGEQTHAWRRARLGDLVEAKYGKALTEGNRRKGSVPVYGSNGVVGSHDMAITSGPTIVIGRKGSSGAVNFSPTPCWPIDTTYYIDDPGPFLIEFLSFLLSSLGLTELDRSSAIPGLNRDQLYALEVPVPSAPEQAELLNFLRSVSDRRDNANLQAASARRTIERGWQAILANTIRGEHGFNGSEDPNTSQNEKVGSA